MTKSPKELNCPICKAEARNGLQIVSATLDQAKVRSGITDLNISQGEAWAINYVCTSCHYKETRKNVGRPE